MKIGLRQNLRQDVGVQHVPLPFQQTVLLALAKYEGIKTNERFHTMNSLHLYYILKMKSLRIRLFLNKPFGNGVKTCAFMFLHFLR